MKKYIFIENDIHYVGGTQTYVAAKAEYLKTRRWKVFVLFDGKKGGKCVFSELDQYVNGGIRGLYIPPGSLFHSIEKSVIGKMLSVVGTEQCDCIVIESGASGFAMWGEILAEKLGAKHICFALCENYKSPKFYFTENLDFFDFKHKRKELAGINDNSLVNLFDGYKEVGVEERYKLTAPRIDNVQDVENIYVDKLIKLDWNICYFGRAEKPYVKAIIDDLCKLSIKHNDKKIQIIFAGNADAMLKYINQKFRNLSNVTLAFLGDLIIIPKKLFQKADVVIAGSGCAEISAYAGALTIIPDPITYRANGVFGYDTLQTTYHEPDVCQMGFDEAVEKVLENKVYANKPINLPKRKTKEEYFDEYFRFIEQSTNIKEYFVKFQKRKKIVIFKRSLKYIAKSCFPFLIYIKQWIKKQVIK